MLNASENAKWQCNCRPIICLHCMWELHLVLVVSTQSNVTQALHIHVHGRTNTVRVLLVLLHYRSIISPVSSLPGGGCCSVCLPDLPRTTHSMEPQAGHTNRIHPWPDIFYCWSHAKVSMQHHLEKCSTVVDSSVFFFPSTGSSIMIQTCNPHPAGSSLHIGHDSQSLIMCIVTRFMYPCIQFLPHVPMYHSPHPPMCLHSFNIAFVVKMLTCVCWNQ